MPVARFLACPGIAVLGSVPMVGLHRLEGFYWVARTGGYASAARAFPHPISQPGVHQQVKKLEEELGLTLFEHAGRKRLQLTPAGRRLFEFVAPFYSQLDGVLRSLGAGDLTGELRIGAASMYLQGLLPAWLKRLREVHPEIRVVTQETQWGEVGRLLDGTLELLIEYLPEIPPELAARQVATVRPFLVVPQGHPLATRARLAPPELAGETFVAYSEGHLRELQEGGLRRLGIEPPHVLTASSALAIVRFVAEGLGWSLLGGLEQRGPRHDGVRAYPIQEPRVEYPVWALWRKNGPPNPMLDAVLEWAPR